MGEHMLDDQQQQPQNQIQPYGVNFGTRAKSRGIPYLPHVPANIGAPNFRARELPVLPVREQQDVMLQDNMRVNQHMLQHNIQQQDSIAYNRRQYPDPQVMSPNRPDEDAPMVKPPTGTSEWATRTGGSLLSAERLIQQVVNFEYDPELRHSVQGKDASIEEIVKEIAQMNQTMGHMSQVLTEAFADVWGDAQNQNRDLQTLARHMALLQTRLQEVSVEISRVSRSEVEPLKERCRKTEFETMNLLRRVQEAQEGANRGPELERELTSAKERIEKLELSSVQTAELNKQSNWTNSRWISWATAWQGWKLSLRASCIPLYRGNRRQLTRNTENDSLHLCIQLRDQYRGLQKDLARQQDKFDRLPVETLEENYKKSEFRLEEIKRLGIRPIRSKIVQL